VEPQLISTSDNNYDVRINTQLLITLDISVLGLWKSCKNILIVWCWAYFLAVAIGPPADLHFWKLIHSPPIMWH